jgi:hypothetical protein
MRRLKLLGLALVAVFVSAAAMSTAAMALEVPENLPALEAPEKRTYTGKNVGSTELRTEGQKPMVCTSVKGESTETTSAGPEGEFHLTFEKCTTEVLGSKVSCTGLGDTTETILELGTWKLVFDREKGKEFKELTTGLLFLNKPTHFSCSILLIEVLAGETLCLHVKATESNVTHEFKCLGPAELANTETS